MEADRYFAIYKLEHRFDEPCFYEVHRFREGEDISISEIKSKIRDNPGRYNLVDGDVFSIFWNKGFNGTPSGFDVNKVNISRVEIESLTEELG